MDAAPCNLWLTFRRCGEGLLLGLPVALVLVLVARRAAGALVEPLSPVGWLFVALAVAAWLCCVMAPISARRSLPRAERLALVGLPLAVAALLGLLLWLPGTAPVSLVAYVAIVTAGGSTRSTLRRSLWRRPDRRDGASDASHDLGDESSEAESLSPGVVQQLVRTREPGQPETLRGTLRVDFVRGQRAAAAHVAICPPFVGPPDCQAAVVSGPAAEVRVVTALPFGVRLDVKLGQVAVWEESVLVEFAIDSTAGPSA
jgi:hypothetical protein